MTEKSGSKKKIVFLIVLVVFSAIFIVGYFVKDRTAEKKTVSSASGYQAPEFRLQKADGSQVSLADLRGRVVMVHFWATWCPPCVEEIPTLDKLYRSLMGKDFMMLAVSEDEGATGAVLSFLRQNRLDVPVLFDPGSTVARLYGTYKLPETYIVDRRGVVRYKALGPRDWTDPTNIQIVRNIIESN